MTWAIVLFLLVVAVWWVYVLVSPTQRKVEEFVFGVGDSAVKFGPRVGMGERLPRVAIVVPGRNEGHLLDRTLRSLCAMDYPEMRVIFVDDQSTDDTPKVTEQLAWEFKNLTIVRNETPPEAGWVGKVWAVHQGLAKVDADAEYLLFCDSDLVFHPQCLRQMMGLAMHRDTDLCSLLPEMETQTMGEVLGLLAAMYFINWVYPLSVANNPKKKKSLVAGGFLLFKRSSYEKLGEGGGHAQVKGQVLEDIALGTLTKSRGMNVFTVVARDLLKARMYEGWGDTFRGLRKNAFAGVHYSYAMGILATLFLVLAGALVPIYPLIAAAWWIAAPSPASLAACFLSVVAAIAMWDVGARTARSIGLPRWSPFFFGPAFAFFLVILVSSMAQHLRGGTNWAGRKLSSASVSTVRDVHRKAG